MQVHEILKEISGIKQDSLKVEILRDKYSTHIPLLRVLKMNFCDTIVSKVPEGAPPFNREKMDGPSKSSLWGYVKHFPMFVRSAASANMKPLQIERIFIEMLEAIDVEEADVMCLAKDKKLTTSYDVSLNVVREAFPQLNIVSAEPPKVMTPEEKAASLIAQSEDLKAKAKALNEEAKEKASYAKELLKSAE